jgi:hypothetical protein
MSERKIVLPTKKSKPTRREPRLTIIYSLPKTGKTTLINTLPNNMIFDLESGTEFLDSMSMQIIGYSPPANETDEQFDARMSPKDGPRQYYLTEAGRAVMEAGRPFDFISVDTATKLEELALPLALAKYQATPMGASFKGDILSLPRGAGYYYLRIAYMELITKIKKLANNVILVAHLKDSVIDKGGKEVNAKDLALTGKIKELICADADAIGYLFRKNNGELMLNFKGTDQVLCGSRCDHLRGQTIKIADYDEENNCLTNINWKGIFPDTIKE